MSWAGTWVGGAPLLQLPSVVPSSLSLSLTHTHTNSHACTHTHTRAHTHTHACTHAHARLLRRDHLVLQAQALHQHNGQLRREHPLRLLHGHARGRWDGHHHPPVLHGRLLPNRWAARLLPLTLATLRQSLSFLTALLRSCIPCVHTLNASFNTERWGTDSHGHGPGARARGSEEGG